MSTYVHIDDPCIRSNGGGECEEPLKLPENSTTWLIPSILPYFLIQVQVNKKHLPFSKTRIQNGSVIRTENS